MSISVVVVAAVAVAVAVTAAGLGVYFLRENKGKFSSTRVRDCSSAMVMKSTNSVTMRS